MSDSKALQVPNDGLPARPSIEGVEDALLDGDLSKLNPQQRVSYMERVCESVGLNPLTKPFRYIRLNGQLTLYATRDAAEQLRKVHGISITSLEETWREDLCIFRAYAKDADGRTDVATGAVDTSRSSGQGLANDIMKAETKAKRRVTLSLAGLGWLDETEISDIPDSATEEVTVDYETGEELHEWQAPTNETFELPPGKIGSLNAAAKALEHEDGADLAAKVEATRNGWAWDGEAGDALEALLTFHEKRLEDEEEPEDEGEPQDPDEIEEAADNVETASEDANAKEFEDDSGLPF